jgi:peroxiredoxin Q/BCP
MLPPCVPAPDFTLPDQNGSPVSLSSFRGRRVVLFFYPRDDSPGCTLEACTFRNQYRAFQDAGAEVVGISPDLPRSHKQFILKHAIPYTLLSDLHEEVSTLYRVSKTLGILPGRATYIIDEEGIILDSYSSQLWVKKHAQYALMTLQKTAYVPSSSQLSSQAK